MGGSQNVLCRCAVAEVPDNGMSIKQSGVCEATVEVNRFIKIASLVGTRLNRRRNVIGSNSKRLASAGSIRIRNGEGNGLRAIVGKDVANIRASDGFAAVTKIPSVGKLIVTRIRSDRAKVNDFAFLDVSFAREVGNRGSNIIDR